MRSPQHGAWARRQRQAAAAQPKPVTTRLGPKALARVRELVEGFPPRARERILRATARWLVSHGWNPNDPQQAEVAFASVRLEESKRLEEKAKERSGRPSKEALSQAFYAVAAKRLSRYRLVPKKPGEA